MKSIFFKRLSQSLENLTIRKKLLISYFILIFFPLLLLTTVSYVNVSKVYKNQMLYSASQSFDQAHTFLNYMVNSLIKSSDVICLNSDVQAILSRSKDEYQDNIVQQNMDRLELEKFFNSYKYTKDVYRVSLYVPGWFTYSNQEFNFSSIDTFSGTDIYKNLMLSKDIVSWLPPHKIQNNSRVLDPAPVISLLRKIRNIEQLSESIGIVKLSILESSINDIVFKANITYDGVVYIQNSEGTLISSSNIENFKQLELNKSNMDTLKGKNITWKIITIGNDEFNVTARAIENTDWTMVTVIPSSEILSQSNKIKDLMIILMLIIGIISYGLSYFISTSTVKRIIILMKKMVSVQEGNLNVKIASQSQDEIGKLTDSFNYMVKRISLLVEEQYQNGKEIKNLELKALQAQINPHFLYNTLDMINWKAIDNNVPEIAVITQSLAKFYKLSLNKGKDIVSIDDEINHVKIYVQIQNLRFENRINLDLDIDPDIYSCTIIKLILQPIIENSIIHGILENSNSQKGSITLTGRFDKDDIILTVEDDGMGMTEEKIVEILTEENTSEFQGYGVRNINQRIKLFFGQQYGLTYHSSPRNGTLVEIRIPTLKAKDNN